MISLISVLGLAAAVAQADGASLYGVVRDGESGEPVAGALVMLADLDRATASGPDGRYRFHAVPAGPQHLEVRRLGYETRTLHALVPPGGEIEINLLLRPVPVALRRLDVRPAVAVRGAEPAAEGEPYPAVGLSADAVRNHPLLAEPDFLAALAGGAVAVQPESPRGVHVRGGGADQVAYLLDGVPVLSPFHAAGLFSAWNPDALARLRLDPAPPAGAAPDALSGVVAAETRRPGAALRAQGAVSTTQARVTVDGPLPAAGAGFLVSARGGFPGFPEPDDEHTYVEGGGSDWLAKLEGALAGGRFRLLGYGNRNRTGAAAVPEGAEGEGLPGGDEVEERRNRFAWGGRSWGGEWARDLSGGGRVRVSGWSASARAAARWASEDPAAARLAATRRDVGGAVVYERGDSAARTTLGLRTYWSRTDYRVGPEGADASYRVAGETRVAALFAGHARSLGGRAGVEAGLLGALYGGSPRLAPRVRLRWTPRDGLTLSAGASRSHQAEQSLRNPESVVGYVFPPALHVGAGAPGVPVARSDQVFVAAELRPAPGVRVAAQAWARGFGGLVLVAPATAQPFAAGGHAVGSGSSRGAALDLAVSGARYALVGSWAWQRVRLAYGDSAYVPDFAAAHTVDAGVIVFPQASLALRLGVSGALGRRATALGGPFEWEACNLLDRGCEFAGSPQQRGEPLGGTGLPVYLRLDAGVRKHWHVRLGGREAVIGAYASAANLLGRRNLLTVRADPATGGREWVEMSSRVPLVVGLDWRF